MSKRVWWSVLLDRGAGEASQSMLIRVAKEAARFSHLQTPYGTTDRARNALCDLFLERSEDPLDTLVMLDMDHEHPADIVARLSAPDEYGVQAALSFMRTRKSDDVPWPLAMNILDRDAHHLAYHTWWRPGEIIECDFAAPCAMAIQRWVLVELRALGFGPPFWRYMYDWYPVSPAEDYYWAESCWRAGIPHYVNTGIVTPHMRPAVNDLETWEAWTTVPALRAIIESKGQGVGHG